MSRTNYNNYSKRPENRETVERPANPVVDVDPVIETIPEIKPEVKPEVKSAAPVQPTKPITKNGVVSDCAKLNIRDGASTTANVLCTVDVNSELVVYINENFGEFYKVCTASGVEGYCMKNYVSLK